MTPMDLFRDQVRIIQGDALAVLRKLPKQSVHALITSPPYWRLRDYGMASQLGLEPSPRVYIKKLVKVFRAARRVLRDDGTLWVNIGDSYAGNGGQYGNEKSTLQGARHSKAGGATRALKTGGGLKRKDLVGIPWMLAFALREDGWYLRQDLIWRKPNGMPSSVTDRCTHNHEYLFLLSKCDTYYFDQDAIKEPAVSGPDEPRNQWNRNGEAPPGQKPQKRNGRSGNLERVYDVNAMNPDIGRNIPWEGTMRNRRSVWDVATDSYEGNHFAVFPPKLIEPCVLAGCPEGGTVLDPFAGTGTLGGVAIAHGRKAILGELNPEYIELIPHRIEQVVRRLRDAPAPAKPPGQMSFLEQLT